MSGFRGSRPYPTKYPLLTSYATPRVYTAIREHWLDTNPGLSGPIFDFIGDISTLESFSVTFAALTGTIPTTIGQLANMTQVRESDTSFWNCRIVV
jgi:hypothetical protein